MKIALGFFIVPAIYFNLDAGESREYYVCQATYATSKFLIKKGAVEVYQEDVDGNKKVLANLNRMTCWGKRL